MPRVGEAWYELSARDEKLVAALRNAEQGVARTGAATERAFTSRATKSLDDTGKAATRFGGTLGGLTDKTSRFGGVMHNVGQGVLQGVGIAGFMGATAAAGALVSGIGKAIEAASDLNETTSKVGVVFGKQSADVLRWGENSATAFGMSRNAALGAAATYGNLFVSLGLAQGKSAEMSKSLVELAGDLASFNNVDPAEALDALRSGLVGETEPLRRFGVNLNEATLAQKALDLGLVKSTKGTLPAAAKAQAAYALILEQTKTAQGDFARTSDGLANRQRIAAAQVEDAFAEVGQTILPIAADIVPALTDAFVSFVHAAQPLIAGLGIAIKVFAAIIGVASKAVGLAFNTMLRVISPIVSTIIGTIKNLAGIAAGIPGPWQDSAKELQATLAGMEDDVEAWGKDTGEAASASAAVVTSEVQDRLNEGRRDVADAAETGITDPIVAATDSAKKEAVRIATATPGDIAEGLERGRSDVASGADALKRAFKEHISPTKEIARLEADLTGKMMKKGLESNDPIIRARALAWQQAIQDRLFVLRNGVGGIALRTGQNYADALARKKTEAANAAHGIRLAAIRQFSLSESQAHTLGANLGRLFADGISDQGSYLYRRVQSYLLNANVQLRASSPPKEGPLHKIDVYAERTAKTYADIWPEQAGYLGRQVAAFLRAAGPELGSSPLRSQVPTLAIADAAKPVMAAAAAPPPAPSAAPIQINATYSPVLGTATRGQLVEAARMLSKDIANELALRGVIARPSGTF